MPYHKTMTTTTPARTWPDTYKTQAMLEIEARFDGDDIRNIILDALATEDRDSDAAYKIGAFSSTLSHWIGKLGIVNEAREIRKGRAS